MPALRATLDLFEWAARAAAGAVRERETTGVAASVTAHRDALMIGGAAVVGLVLLLADVSLGGLLFLAVVLAAYELVVYRVGTVAPAASFESRD